MQWFLEAHVMFCDAIEPLYGERTVGIKLNINQSDLAE